MEPAFDTQDHPLLFGLPYLALYQAEGRDTVSFLQGQLTNDIKLLAPEQGLIAGFCTPKGRLLALFHLLQRDHSALLCLPAEIAAPVIKRLSMYLLRADVRITSMQETLTTLGLAGPGCAETLETALGFTPPQQPGAVIQQGELTIARAAGEAERFLIIVPTPEVDELKRNLALDYRENGNTIWRLLDIRAGIPTIVTATQDEFIPQMVNMDLINGLNFKKGCYTGQEIVARTHYRGKVKRRMFRATTTGPVPVPGTPVHAGGHDQPVGQVVDAVETKGDQTEMLLVLQLAQAETGELHLGPPDGPVIDLLELPYSFDSADA
ncbi:MAG: folate-binding protein [Gammaproteobacteria bacterium]|nr:folate-binding protein [Gammaproteobacteria bacterium]